MCSFLHALRCVCVCLFLYRYLMYVFILVSYFVCLSVFVCVTDARQSSDQPGTSSRQRGQSHSLIILTFLHNDPMHNSPFSAFFSLPPSICLTHAFHFTPIHSLYIYISFLVLSTSSPHSSCLLLTIMSISDLRQLSHLLTLLLYVFPAFPPFTFSLHGFSLSRSLTVLLFPQMKCHLIFLLLCSFL